MSAKEVKRNVHEGASYRVEMPSHTVRLWHCPSVCNLPRCLQGGHQVSINEGPRGIFYSPCEGTELKGRGLEDHCMLTRAQACVAAVWDAYLHPDVMMSLQYRSIEPQQVWDCAGECQSGKDATDKTRLTSCAYTACVWWPVDARDDL